MFSNFHFFFLKPCLCFFQSCTAGGRTCSPRRRGAGEGGSRDATGRTRRRRRTFDGVGGAGLQDDAVGTRSLLRAAARAVAPQAGGHDEAGGDPTALARLSVGPRTLKTQAIRLATKTVVLKSVSVEQRTILWF